MTGTLKTGDLETRLTAALQARAEQVTPESLPPLAVPEPRVVPFVRRPATWAVAAAAAAVLIALPFVLGGTTHRSERPPTTEGPSPTETATPSQLTGDLDGDGYTETVSIDEHGVISVVLASSSSGTPLTVDAGADGTTIAGLASIDPAHPKAHAILSVDHGLGQVFRVTDAGLTEVLVRGEEDYETFTAENGMLWGVADDRLLIAYDTGVPNVWVTMRYLLGDDGKLDTTTLGELCVEGDALPVPCGGGAGVVEPDDNYQVPLFPRATDSVRPGGSMPIAIDGGGEPGQITLDGSKLTVDWPGGSPAESVTIPGEGSNELLSTLMSGTEVPGIVVLQTHEDGYKYYLLVTWRAGHLTLLDTGGQTYAGDDQNTWLSTTGRLFTAWPDQSSSGSFVKEWKMTETGVESREITNADGSKVICFGPGANEYDAC